MNEVEEVEEQVADSPVEGGEVDAGETPQVEPLINQDKVQERFNKITADKLIEKNRADNLQKELDEIKAKPQPTEAPKIEDFDYDESKHSEAQIQFEVNKKFEEQRIADRQVREEGEFKKQATTFASKEAKFAENHKDYYESVRNLPQLPNEVINAIYSMDNGPEVVQYLSKHLDVADEIASSSSGLAGVKLGQISAVLTANNKTVETSNAPDPVQTISGGASVNKKMEDMSDEEFEAMRREQRKKEIS